MEEGGVGGSRTGVGAVGLHVTLAHSDVTAHRTGMHLNEFR